jgi:hypothetical protein
MDIIDAEDAVLAAWPGWRTENLPADKVADGRDAFLFFGDLQSKRPELLSFPYNGDRWQAIHGWLLHRRLVSD